MTPVTGPSDRKSARGINLAGAALIALAFALPFIAIPFGYSTAFDAGDRIARTLGSLLLLVLVAWAVTRGRSETAKASGRLIAGALLCVVVGGDFVRAGEEKQIGKTFMREAFAFQAAQASRFVDLGRRFDEVALDTVLTPQMMTSEAGRATARATLAQYRALLAERRLLLQTYLTEFDRFIATIPPSQTREGALSAVGNVKQTTVDLYARLDKSQTRLVDAMGAIVDWSAAQVGKLKVSNGKLIFSSEAQETELQVLLDALNDAEAKNAEVVTVANAAVQKAQASLVENKQKAEALLQR
jgi:hypothetical protein